MRLLDATRQFTRLDIDRDHRRMGWFALGVTAAGVLSLAVAVLFFDL